MKYLILLFTVCVFFSCSQEKTNKIDTEPIRDISGEYIIEGWEPGQDIKMKPAYTGKGTIRKVGESYEFEAIMDGEKYTGIGIASDNTVSFCFKGSDGSVGVDLFKINSDGSIYCLWLYMGDKKGMPGEERWYLVDK